MKNETQGSFGMACCWQGQFIWENQVEIWLIKYKANPQTPWFPETDSQKYTYAKAQEKTDW